MVSSSMVLGPKSKPLSQYRWTCFDPAGQGTPIYGDNWTFVYESVMWVGEARCPNGWTLKIEEREVSGIPLKFIQNIAHGTLHRIIWAGHPCTAKYGDMLSCYCLQDIFHQVKKDELTRLYYKMLETLKTDTPNCRGLQPVTAEDIVEIRKISAYPYLGRLDDTAMMELLSLGEICHK